MEEKEQVLEKRVIRLPDGRRLVFYEFPEREPRDPPPRTPAKRPASEEP